MNLTKKSKLTALITVTVMCLAIIITAGVIFVPKIYNRSDTDVVTAADDELSGLSSENSYGMKAPVFSGSNMKAVKYTGVENGGASILYPSVIYMDVTETLESLGYYFFVDAYYTSCTQNPGIAILYNVFGYYSKIPYNTSNNNAEYFSKDSEYYALMRVFGDSQNSYRISDHKGLDNCYEIENSSDDHTNNNIRVENPTKIFVPNKKESHVTGTIQISGKPDANYIKNQKKDTFKYTNTTEKVLFGYQKYRLIKSWTTTKNSHVFNFDNASGAVTLNGIATNYTSSMDISLNIYDKAPLLKAMKELDAKYNALLGTTLLLGGENNRYGILKDAVVKLLTNREVTQSQLDAKQKEVEDYVFKTCIGDPNLGSQDSPKTEPYGKAYGLHNFWMGYDNPISSTNTKLSSCFSAGAMNYYPNGYDSGGTPVNDSNKNQLTEAGYYDVTFAPDTSKKTISVGGQFVDVSFSWSDGTTTSRTAY
ncbi:MAG: hypothetical protein K2N53_03360, partial [Clostridia bacterium]|nr:hypothetical protein [Clostridia bacterium]